MIARAILYRYSSNLSFLGSKKREICHIYIKNQPTEEKDMSIVVIVGLILFVARVVVLFVKRRDV